MFAILSFSPESLTTLNLLVGGGLFLTSFILSLPLLWLVKKYAEKIKLVDQPGKRKIHAKPMPIGGGIGIFASTILVLLGFFFLARELAGNNFQEWLQLCEMDSQFQKDLLVILGGGTVIFVMGLIDDYKNLGPYTKLAVEVLVAIMLFCCDIRVTLFIDSQVFSFFVTIAWIILITNAFNLLDNMDGLSAGVALISGAIFVWAAVTVNQWAIVFLLMALLGSLLGFLRYNFPPASIFMGDCGSLFIGYMMSTLTVYATFYQAPFPLFPVALPLLVLAVPLFDTATVVLYRWQRGKPIFQGDKNHFSHRLVSLGMTTRRAVLVIYFITLSTAIMATLLYQVNWLGTLVIVGQLFCILMIIHLLERTGARFD